MPLTLPQVKVTRPWRGRSRLATSTCSLSILRFMPVSPVVERLGGGAPGEVALVEAFIFGDPLRVRLVGALHGARHVVLGLGHIGVDPGRHGGKDGRPRAQH
jgi:hypothetical protein